jgi:hypothetical protein
LTVLLRILRFVHSEGIGQLHNQLLASNQTTNTIRQELVLLRSDLTGKPKESSNEPCDVVQGRSTRSRIIRKQSVVCRYYTSIFGKLLIRRVSQVASFCDTKLRSAAKTCSTTTESSWVFMPSFLSLCFEYQSMSTSRFIQGALRIYPLIPNDHPIWRMCGCGDLEGVQTLLSTRQVSPFSVDTDGRTLLHVGQRTTPSSHTRSDGRRQHQTIFV